MPSVLTQFYHVIGKAGPSGFGSGSKAEDVAAPHKDQIDGKVVIVTGGNSGIGRETVRVLSKNGAQVILACRTVAKGNAVREELMKEDNNAEITVLPLDLSSFDSVHEFAKQFKALKKPLHLLVNNAGVMLCPLEYTKDGHEMHFGTNHLGHFLLTELMLPNLKASAPSRIVNLSSAAYALPYTEGIRFDDLKGEEYYSKLYAYGQSKLCNLLHAKELNERLQNEKVQVTANAVHPGVFASELQRHMGIFGPIWNTMFRPYHKSIAQAAATSIYVATAPELQGGQYFYDCNVAPIEGDYGDNMEMARKLREVSFQLTN